MSDMEEGMWGEGVDSGCSSEAVSLEGLGQVNVNDTVKMLSKKSFEKLLMFVFRCMQFIEIHKVLEK